MSRAVFFIDTQDGRVASRRQLLEAALVDEDETPVKPWHPIPGPPDASTMWYAVMRKKIRGVFIGMLCIRHLDRQASLESQGWVEIPIEAIRVQ